VSTWRSNPAENRHDEFLADTVISPEAGASGASLQGLGSRQLQHGVF
jgi:hypothetical protein